MGFSRPESSLFSLGLLARAAVIGVLAFCVSALLITNHLYATAIVTVGVAAIVFLDLRKTVSRADRVLGRFVGGLAAGDLDGAGQGAAGFVGLGQAIDRAIVRVRTDRMVRQRQIDYLQTLVDSVPGALVAVELDGRINLVNRAARTLAGGGFSRFADIATIGAGAAETLLALAPGRREIVRLQDGRRMLASALEFRTTVDKPQRLISLQDIAVELDAVELKAWQDLVSVLAHEMLNSLTPISSLAESLQHGVHSPVEVSAAVEAIGRRSLGLMHFVDRYRKVAEIPRPVLKPVHLARFFAGLDRLMATTLEAAHVSYHSRVEPPDLVISFDADLLEQAIINLLTNAIDAVSTVTAPSISLSCCLVDERVEMSVADNGPGLPNEIKDKLFVPFFTTKTGGSGIGLSVARQIALAHKGQLEVHQLHPNGTAFTLSMPANAIKRPQL